MQFIDYIVYSIRDLGSSAHIYVIVLICCIYIYVCVFMMKNGVKRRHKMVYVANKRVVKNVCVCVCVSRECLRKKRTQTLLVGKMHMTFTQAVCCSILLFR